MSIIASNRGAGRLRFVRPLPNGKPAPRLPYNVQQAILKRCGARPLGLIDSYEEDILEALEEIFGANILANIGLSEKDTLTAIGKAAYYYRTGAFTRSRAAAPALRDAIARDMKISTAAGKSSILKILFFLEDIGPDRPVLNTYLSTRPITTDTRIEAVKAGAGKIASNITEGARDTIKESLQVVTRAAGEGLKVADENLPWYMKPRTLLIGGAIAAFVVYGLPLLKALPRPSYRPNPVPLAEVKRAKAEGKYKEFHKRPPRRRIALPAIDTSELVQLGSALEIGYKSDKWTGKKQNYLHQFGKGVRLCSTPDGKALVILGGKLNVEERGITG